MHTMVCSRRRLLDLADTEAVAVTDIADDARKLHAGLAWEPSLARIGVGGDCEAEECEAAGDEEETRDHAAFFNAPSLTFFFRRARTNLSHFAMPARFSGRFPC